MRRRSHKQHCAIIALVYSIVVAIANKHFHAAAAVDVAPIRVNVGGDTTTDIQGNVWESDDTNKYYSTGNVVWACPKAIINTDNDFVYCTYRWFNQVGTPYRYTFPQVTKGSYVIRLHFAELYVMWAISQFLTNTVILSNSFISALFQVFQSTK